METVKLAALVAMVVREVRVPSVAVARQPQMHAKAALVAMVAKVAKAAADSAVIPLALPLKKARLLPAPWASIFKRVPLGTVEPAQARLEMAETVSRVTPTS